MADFFILKSSTGWQKLGDFTRPLGGLRNARLTESVLLAFVIFLL